MSDRWRDVIKTHVVTESSCEYLLSWCVRRFISRRCRMWHNIIVESLKALRDRRGTPETRADRELAPPVSG